MRGRRVFGDERGKMLLDHGEYGQLAGIWWVRPPRGSATVVQSYRVEEHEDGTITVTELIERAEWTGYLLRGVWSELRAE